MNNARLQRLYERDAQRGDSYGNEGFKAGGKKPDHVEEELTLGDLVPIKKASAINAHQPHANGAGFERSTDFYGGVNGQNLGEKMANYVPGDAARRIREKLSDSIELRKPIKRPRTRTNRDEGEGVGDPFEYTLWRQGAQRDQTWWERTEEVQRRRHGEVTMHCDIGLTCGEPEDALEFSGAAALALIDLLEPMGYRVTLFATLSVQLEHPSSRRRLTLDQRIAVKGADERLSPNAMALICKGGISRVAMFSNWDSHENVKCNYHYGYPKRYHGEHVPDIQVPKNIRNEATAFEWVAEMLAAFQEEDE